MMSVREINYKGIDLLVKEPINLEGEKRLSPFFCLKRYIDKGYVNDHVRSIHYYRFEDGKEMINFFNESGWLTENHGVRISFKK